MKGALNRLRRWQFLSAALALVGLIDSLYLWSAKVSRPLVCGVGDCDLVNASPYSMLLGIPVAAIGAAGYALLLVLALLQAFAFRRKRSPFVVLPGRVLFQRRTPAANACEWALAARAAVPTVLTDVRLWCAGIGVFFSAYLTGIEVFILQTICIWCVLSATVILAIFLGLIVERRAERALESITPSE